MIAFVSTSLGWTWEEAGQLDLPRLGHYTRTWAQYPPTHVTLAHLGRSFGALKPYTAPPKASAKPVSEIQDLSELERIFPVFKPDGLDSSKMTAEEIDKALDRMFFGQEVAETL